MAFRDEMVREELANYQAFEASEQLVFFDRSIVDSYGYSLLETLPVPESLLSSCNEIAYNAKVFIFPPWDSIFINDQERKQDFDEAIATYEKWRQPIPSLVISWWKCLSYLLRNESRSF